MEPVQLSERAAAQVKSLMEAADRLNEQTRTYIAGLSDALGVPAGWQLDIRAMAFVAPPEPPAATPEPEQGDGDAK